MSTRRAPPTTAPPAYRYVAKYYGRSLRPIVMAAAVITAIWCLAWTVTSFKQLTLDKNDNLPQLSPLAIAQGVIYAVVLSFQVYGVVAAGLQRYVLLRIYALLCALSALMLIGIGFMRVITHFTYKSELIEECVQVAKTGESDWVFGVWGAAPVNILNDADATSYCDGQWNHDSWVEIVILLIEIVLGLLFTAIAFAYCRQALDPTSPVNASRAPSDQVRRDGYSTYYSPPYEAPEYAPAYAPAYAPPSGPPPVDGKPPDYKPGLYATYGEAKEFKHGDDDPFSDYDGPSIPLPTQWVEDRDTESPKV